MAINVQEWQRQRKEKDDHSYVNNPPYRWAVAVAYPGPFRYLSQLPPFHPVSRIPMKRTTEFRLLVLVVLMWTMPRVGVVAQPAPPPGLEAYVEAVRTAFDVPGLALAIVQDGQVVVAGGYGVGTLG